MLEKQESKAFGIVMRALGAEVALKSVPDKEKGLPDRYLRACLKTI
jgi:hypothetical protein